MLFTGTKEQKLYLDPESVKYDHAKIINCSYFLISLVKELSLVEHSSIAMFTELWSAYLKMLRCRAN